MTGRGLRRMLALVAGISLPSAGVVLFLYVSGRLDPRTAAIAFVVAVGLTALAALPAALSLAVVRDAIESLGADPAGGAESLRARRPRGLTPAAHALRLSVARAWRGVEALGNEARARLAAAEAVIAGLPDPLILLDAQRRIVRANAASVELIGAVPEARDLAASLRNPAVLAAADAVLRGEAARVVEFSLTVPVERWLSARFARIDGPSLDGSVAVLTLHDITALKRAEQMRADFIANAGHELKTPLASLIGFVETLRGPARDDAAVRERFLGIMQEQAERMGRLVNDLLSLSRIELNEHVAPTGRVELAPVIEHIADTLELRAADRRMALALPDDLPAVLGDADELAQVFQNLLDNAIKYGRPATDITVTAVAERGFVRVSVTDRGDGIPPEHLPRLTERFYRVDTARSRELGGTGLGLAVVKHILNRHRGRLEIDSTLGQGSIFTVWLRAGD
ncbi:MAG TPA: ATP-binding protein [Stellaceae bacterium]|jgi:two-component system phosphate regulon sensor histidine kinase PhoR|nr:ATP-binding protein [Stellaceae bacterium]